MNKDQRSEAEVYDEYASRLQRGEDVVDHIIYDKAVTLRKDSLILKWLPDKPCLILDYGCGNGGSSRFMADLGHKVVAFDLSKSMIRYARSLRCSREICYLVASGEDLPFRESVFDTVVGIGIFHHLKLLKGLKECYRSLGPSGTLKIMEPNTLNPLSFVGRRAFGTQIHTANETTYTLWSLRDSARKAGFSIIDTNMISLVGYSLAFLSAWLSLRSTRTHGFKRLVSLLRKSTALIVLVDKLCENLPFVKNTCWIIAMNLKRTQ